MSSAAGLVEAIAFFGMFIAVGAVAAAPELLAGWASDRRDRFLKEAACQAEIERKLAIAEAAIAARRRGETYVPPSDYDR
jgi:hypothetical protein